jgi:hydroxypyruvate isomerase
VSREKQHEICVETMIRLGELAKGHDVTIVMEPLNILVNHMGYYLVTSAEGFQMMREVGSPKVKLLFDIYHQQISEGNLIRNITENIDLIGHFHMGDNPGRLEPGTGEINYTNIFAAIQKTDYDGYLAFECGRSVENDVLCERMHALIDPFAD